MLTEGRDVISFPVGGREATRPRQRGLTMVIDKGLGLAQTRDLLELAGEYIDFIKLAFGTCILYPPHLLRSKIELVKSHGIDIYPGGTLLEVVVCQGRLGEFFRWAGHLGFTTVEVSEGTLDLDPAVRRLLIREAAARGFRVLGEVGKKDPLKRMSAAEMVAQVEDDLRQGALRVIVEGRDSGHGVGIYGEDGSVREDMLEEMMAGLSDPAAVIWEAPQASQQRELLIRMGPNVNLGNIQPPDVVTLESMRVGLRSDTFRLTLDVSGAFAPIREGQLP